MRTVYREYSDPKKHLMSATFAYMECASQVRDTKRLLTTCIQEGTKASCTALAREVIGGLKIYPEQMKAATPLYEEDDREFFCKNFVPLLTPRTSTHVREYLDEMEHKGKAYQCITRVIAFGKPDGSPLDEELEAYLCTQFRVCHALRMVSTRKAYQDLQAASRDFLNAGGGDTGEMVEACRGLLGELTKVDVPFFWYVWADTLDLALKSPRSKQVAEHFNLPLRVGSKIGFVTRKGH